MTHGNTAFHLRLAPELFPCAGARGACLSDLNACVAFVAHPFAWLDSRLVDRLVRSKTLRVATVLVGRQIYRGSVIHAHA